MTVTISAIAPTTVRAARRLRPLNVRAMNFILSAVLITAEIELAQLAKSVARRWESTGAEPPPPDGHLPSVASSKLLRSTRDAALRTPGIKWLDEHGSSPLQNTIGGRETRKMNVYQAIRDAMG
jgi:2-oxoisovalerate dehydrogenase E1 component beta subunit